MLINKWKKKKKTEMKENEANGWWVTSINKGNPSSSHQYGVVTKGGVERAREKVALLLSSHNDEIVFTSGGTESNNYSIKGAALANKYPFFFSFFFPFSLFSIFFFFSFSSSWRGLRNKGNHVITTCIEHPAVLETVKYLQDYEGFKITYPICYIFINNTKMIYFNMYLFDYISHSYQLMSLAKSILNSLKMLLPQILYHIHLFLFHLFLSLTNVGISNCDAF